MENELKAAVEKGGGKWRGYMEGLVYFDSPATGSTLAMKEASVSADAVAAHIAASNAKFAK